MGNKRPLVSLCIPTNGVSEWVFPVLESIYNQGVEHSEFEVVITDNGNNEEFEKQIKDLLADGKYENLVYKKTEAYEFLNEPEAYKIANGYFIKFINHRTKLLPGALARFIKFVNENKENKPVVYFSNGVLEQKEEIATLDSFDGFVRGLTYFSSWSTGMGFWKEDFDALPSNVQYNTLFPHVTILFSRRNASNYIIDNSVLLDEIPTGKKPKGKFNLFYAWGVEYPGILSDLLRTNDITLDTFLYLKNETEKYTALWFLYYVILKRYCSFDLSDYKKTLNVYFSLKRIKKEAVKHFLKLSIKKITRIFHKGK